MDATIDLCQVASVWREAPQTSRPIVRNIKSEVFPKIRRMRAPYFQELARLRMDQRRRQVGLQAAGPSPKSTTEHIGPRPPQASLASIEATLAALAGQRPHNCNTSAITSRPSALHETHSGHRTEMQPRSDADWTEDEDVELIRQLGKKASRNLPRKSALCNHRPFYTDQTAKLRYIEIQKCPVLQNKSLSQIRDRALSLKGTMLETKDIQ